MPRRIPDYPDIYWGWNFVSSIGSFLSVLGAIIFWVLIILMIYNYFRIKLYSSTYLLFFSGSDNIFVRKCYKNSSINLFFYKYLFDYRLKSKIFIMFYNILNRINFIDFIIYKFVFSSYKNKYDL